MPLSDGMDDMLPRTSRAPVRLQYALKKGESASERASECVDVVHVSVVMVVVVVVVVMMMVVVVVVVVIVMV
jgi:hypothetical protein